MFELNTKFNKLKLICVSYLTCNTVHDLLYVNLKYPDNPKS